ncbi:hypothetical protein G9A89_006301 [Geosiphon pyriformis]|nr:hypothetical protein G9A89_006301 [Geosiphon pyriformis]
MSTLDILQKSAFITSQLDKDFFRVLDFYREFRYPYDARAAAEKDYLEALDIIIKRSTAKTAKKAKNLRARAKYDVTQFWYTSFWEGLEMEYQRTQINLSKEKLDTVRPHTTEEHLSVNDKNTFLQISESSAENQVTKLDKIGNNGCREKGKEPEITEPARSNLSIPTVLLPSGDEEFGLEDKILFRQKFEDLENSKKWMLQSGRFVEDVLFELGMICQYHNLVHSFILDIEDSFVEKAFSKAEILEITEKENTTDPDIEEELLEYINTFDKGSTTEIRAALNKPHPRLENGYDPQEDFAYDHVRTTVADWLRLLEMKSNPLTLQLPEAWYRVNVWRTIDIAFSNIPNTLFIGGEVIGLASSERKNRYRTSGNVGPMQRKLIGKKGDGYLRTIGSISTDWAASEAGPKWEGEHGTKFIKECGISLPRTLKDILVKLARNVDFSEQKLRKFNVVGFIHAGAVMVLTNLDCPAGYICRYRRGKALEVQADVKNFSKSLDVLVEIIYAKLRILQTMEVMNDDVDSGSKHSRNINKWKLQKELKRSHNNNLPECHPTPKKKK